MSSDDKHKSSYDLRSNGIFLFASDVDEEVCADAIEFILECNLDDNPPYDHLTLIINSHGGSVVDGFALLDVMAGSRLPVWTVGVGMLASMGLMLFMGGQKGNRTLTPNTMILSHQWSSVNWGKEHELIASKKKNDLVSQMIMRHYRKCTKLKDKDIRKLLLPESDVWLSASEAKEYGICDVVKLID